MEVNGLFAHTENHADLPGRLPLRGPAQHIQFPLGQSGHVRLADPGTQQTISRCQRMRRQQLQPADHLHQLRPVGWQRLFPVHAQHEKFVTGKMQLDRDAGPVAIGRLHFPQLTHTSVDVGLLVVNDRRGSREQLAHHGVTARLTQIAGRVQKATGHVSKRRDLYVSITQLSAHQQARDDGEAQRFSRRDQPPLEAGKVLAQPDINQLLIVDFALAHTCQVCQLVARAA
mmetsp:Transcript_5502/g.13164  ORF Transcript_5502/g.13164 Transcript_5502/m.13164 type:complete len:229 (-) Transcript_5502:3426-4112(-)